MVASCRSICFIVYATLLQHALWLIFALGLANYCAPMMSRITTKPWHSTHTYPRTGQSVVCNTVRTTQKQHVENISRRAMSLQMLLAGFGVAAAGKSDASKTSMSRSETSIDASEVLLTSSTVSISTWQPRAGQSSGRLLVFSPGFLVDRTAYASLCEAAATHGFHVIAYNVVEDAMAAQDDAGRAALLSDIIAWAMGSLGLPASSQVFLAGHSKGAKLSALAAAGDERVKGLVLIDPVDATYEQIEGSVSALDLYANGPVRSIPTLIIGAGRNRDCVPPFANYQQFFKVMPGPTWLVVIQQAGHLQFLDQMTTLQQAVCSVGKVGLGEVPAATAELVTSWLDAVGVQMLPTAVHGVDPKDTGSTSGSEQRQVRTLDAVSADDVQQAMVAVVQEVLKVHPDLQLSIDAQL